MLNMRQNPRLESTGIMGKLRILAIGSHPDDIELGCGGTLFKAAQAGHEVYMYILSRGDKSGNPAERTRELFESATFLGAKTLWIDNFVDTQLTVGSSLVNHIEYFIHRADPDLILTHPLKDYHHDHRAVAECTVEAARNSQNVLAYEIPVTKEFNPQLYYDISSVIEEKLKLASIFLSQAGKVFTLGNTIKGMAEYRALQNRLDGTVTHAEAFEVLKLCVNSDFNMTKFAKRTVPLAVFHDIGRSLKEIIEYTPSAAIAERLKSADKNDTSILTAPPAQVPQGKESKEKMLLSSLDLAKALGSANVTTSAASVEQAKVLLEG